MRRLIVVWWWAYNVFAVEECGIPPCQSGCYLNADDQCVPTPGGFFSPTDANELYECEAGTFSKTGYGFCLGCPPGSYTKEKASSSCQPCPHASYTPEPGFVECIQCNAALYSGWGSDRVVTYGGQDFCQRPGSTNQILTLTPTLSPTGSSFVSIEPTATWSSSPSRSPQPTVNKDETTEAPSILSSQQQPNNMTGAPATADDEGLSAMPSLSPLSSLLSPATNATTGTPITPAPTRPPSATSEQPTQVENPHPPIGPPVATKSNRFRNTFFRVLPVFLAALVVTILACCVKSYKTRGSPMEVRAIQPSASAKTPPGGSPSGEECSSMGDVYLDDEDYDDLFALVELGSSSGLSSSETS